MDLKKEEDSIEKKKIIVNMIIFSQISIFVPLIIFGSLGFLLYKKFQNPYLLLISVFVSSLITNFLLVKRLKSFLKKIKSHCNKNLKD